MPRRVLAILLGTLFVAAIRPTSATAFQTPPKVSAEEDNDALAGARVSPNRGDMEALIRAIGRDPVSDELVDRIDALFRPRWTRPASFWPAKNRAVEPAIVGILDEIAKELTNKPADTRMIVSRVALFYNSPGRDEIRAGYREELAHETGPRKTIKGRILDDPTGRPIANVAVSASGVMTRTDARGDYVLKARNPGSDELCLSFEANGFALTQTWFRWDDLLEAEPTTSDLRLLKAQPFTGHVFDPLGKPIEGVKLELYLTSEASCRDGSVVKMGHGFCNILDARTDAAGAYSFHHVPPDLPKQQAVSSFFIKHPKYVGREKHYAENELLGPGWEITLEPGCDVRGIVTDTKGKPVKGASVTAFSGQNITEEPSTQTDAEGRYTLEGLTEARVRIIVNPREHAMKMIPVDLKKGAPTELNVTVEDGYYFTGKVIGADGKPAVNAHVGWIEPVNEKGQPIDHNIPSHRFARTKEDGTFRVGPVAKGRYQITGLVDPPRAEAKMIVETDGKEILLELQPGFIFR